MYRNAGLTLFQCEPALKGNVVGGVTDKRFKFSVVRFPCVCGFVVVGEGRVVDCYVYILLFASVQPYLLEAL